MTAVWPRMLGLAPRPSGHRREPVECVPSAPRPAPPATDCRPRVWTSLAAVGLLVGLFVLAVVTHLSFGLDEHAYRAAIHGIETARASFR